MAKLDTPPLASLPGLCAKCGWRVWVALSSPQTDRVLCFPCAMGAIEASAKVAVTEAQLADVADYLQRKARH